MKAIIPAAGYATRLYPLTKNQPKALLNIAGEPMIEHCLEKIEALWEIDTVYIVTNDKFAPHFTQRQKQYQGKLEVCIVNDGTKENETRLGALGDLQFVIDTYHLDEDILIMAWDNLFEDSLQEIYNIFTIHHCSTIATYDIGEKEKATAFGVLETRDDGQVVSFEEKPQNPKSSLISTMIYFIKKEDVPLIKDCIERGKADNGGDFIATLVRERKVYAVPLKGYRYDIGNKDQLDVVKKVLGE